MTRFESHVALDASTRQSLVSTLNTQLATLVDLHWQTKQAHWNVKGREFLMRHELFDRLAEHARGWADDVAERAGALGGYARGTARMSAENTVLPEYDVEAVDGTDHVRTLIERFEAFTSQLRDALGESAELGDPITEDPYTEIARQAELDLYFLQSHLDNAA